MIHGVSPPGTFKNIQLNIIWYSTRRISAIIVVGFATSLIAKLGEPRRPTWEARREALRVQPPGLEALFNRDLLLVVFII